MNWTSRFNDRMKTGLSIFLLATVLATGSACSVRQKTNQAETPPPDLRPEWVKTRPFRSGVYTGVGSASKVGTGADHQSQAKYQALNDLASEISVTISGSSLLYQAEANDRYAESFQSSVKTRTVEQLTGYELSGIYEDDNQYWVWYTLDKAIYASDKEIRKQKAIELALFHRGLAKDHLTAGEDILAIEHYLKALEDLHDFWNEALKTEVDGKEDLLGNRLLSELGQLVRNIRIDPISEKYELLIGKNKREDLAFEITGQSGTALENAPVFVNLKGYRMRTNQLTSDRKGIVVAHDLPKELRPEKSELRCTLNMVNLIERSTKDPMIAMLANSISPPSASCSVQFRYPSIQVVQAENPDGTSSHKNGSEEFVVELKSLLNKSGFAVVDQNGEMRIEVGSIFRESIKRNKFIHSSIDLQLKLIDDSGKLLNEVNAREIKGTHLSAEQSKKEALDKAREALKRRYYRDLLRPVFP